ncbi:sensor histidine kinase [Candidatus Uabimicrobium amorphum]|uniref:histidine kinase n=1 Tax=Uabimicrobium amorphum TaxID=2596890 RepID=A0A5S9F3F7_UABAM|nr:GAF domain-containing sensor histidine kinase [Candidatus Uabimicrobium amorphum]BBM84695.1 two-component system sensor histidinekinase/response regulator [Candidatus Uabimicrobium amorphum]
MRQREKHYILQIISEIQKMYIDETKPNILFDKMLNYLLEITESEYGFIGEVRYKEDGSPFLKTYALSNIAWNEETRDFYDKNAPTGLEFYNLNTLFGYTIIHKEIVISNNPKDDPRAQGLPKGHPPLHKYLGIPFFLKNRFVGMVGIANAAEDYSNASVEYLEPITSTCCQLIVGYQEKAKLKSLIQELNNQKQKEIEANKVKDRFIANMSHEIRSPLQSIIGYTDLLLFDPVVQENDEIQEKIKVIESSSEHLLNIVNSILDFSKINSGTIDVKFEKIDLDKFANKIELYAKTLNIENNNQFVLQNESNYTKFDSDITILYQVMINLISNAMKFTKNGKVVVQIISQEESGLPYIIFAVKDNGVGIKKSYLANIFQEFSQQDDTIKKEYGGTGLGLALTKKLVELLKGELNVESKEKVGSTFSIKMRVSN